MSQADEDDKPWTENDLKEAIRRINAGEINFKEAEDYYGISPRTIHRQRAIENMRAQLNPEKAKKTKASSSSTTKKDVTILRKPVDISCSSITDVVTLLNTGTEEVKQLLNHECDIIYECKVCKNLFRSLVNFISHKRIYCCDMYSVIHTRTDDNQGGSETSDAVKEEEKLKSKDNLKEFSAKPFRITCRKDLTSVLKRITVMSEFLPSEPILHLQNLENTSSALQQVILSNEPSDAAQSPKLNTDSSEHFSASLEVDSKKETAIIVGKSQEKPDVIEKPANYIAEKRFRCPVCPSNFTIKKSVMRHLKSVHDKSVEQLERLKPRIQMHYVRKKTSNENTKQLQEEKNSSIGSNCKAENVNSEQNKSNGEKDCRLCNRTFINRSSYAAHIKTCRKNAYIRNNDIDCSEPTKKNLSLVPVVSLTPIMTSSISPTENDDASETLTSRSKKLATASSSKKVALPLSASSSFSKKIGIQVRMNYHKENFNQANSINGASASHAATSVTDASCHSSTNNSRRNSLVMATEAENDFKSQLMNGHNTRSTDKLANVLERLLDKHGLKKLEKSEAVQGGEEKSRRTLAKNEVSVYCEDCKTTFALNEYKCNVESKLPRTFKCALRNCDFRCTDNSELLPHLSARHAIMSEGELAEVDSTFIAETTGMESVGNECGCNEKSKDLDKSKSQENSIKEESERVDSNNPQASEKMHSECIPNKRKLSVCSSKQMLIKRKAANVKESSFTVNKNKLNENKVSATPECSDNFSENNTQAKILNVNEDSADNDVENIRVNQLVLIKKSKKVKTEADTKIRAANKVPVRTKDVELMNGVISSSDEDTNVSSSHILKSKLNTGVSFRKQNSNSLPSDTKITKPSTKGSNFIFNDFSPSSSTLDSDLDPSTMSEENLKKSIMTIIFGKDVLTEKIEERISNEREKSPTCSSTSSECGKEKRFSVRIAKQTSTKNIPSSVCKDDKVLKMSISNKLKASR